MKKKRRFDLKGGYGECWEYLKESKKFIYISVGIFFVFALLGLLVPVPASLVEIITEFIEELLLKTEGMTVLQLVRFIFFNNLQSTFFGMMLGIFFGIFPALSAVANGYILGYASALTIGEGGVLSLFTLLPHGIFEFPAIFISLGLGLRLGSLVLKRNSQKVFKKNILMSLKTFLLIVLPLLVIAGIIEGCLIASLN